MRVRTSRDNAFYTTGLSSITLPNSIKNIDEGDDSWHGDNYR